MIWKWLARRGMARPWNEKNRVIATFKRLQYSFWQKMKFRLIDWREKIKAGSWSSILEFFEIIYLIENNERNKNSSTLFPHIGNLFFEFWNCSQFKKMPQYFKFFLNKLKFSCGNYSRTETIWGNTVITTFKKLQYSFLILFVHFL